jgi:hypothetical protein
MHLLGIRRRYQRIVCGVIIAAVPGSATAPIDDHGSSAARSYGSLKSAHSGSRNLPATLVEHELAVASVTTPVSCRRWDHLSRERGESRSETCDPTSTSHPSKGGIMTAEEPGMQVRYASGCARS